ncbi:LacI family DNA-binding transcriptional regulator [Pseudarthrobacter sp. NPDC058119]|uniref:LacI family DNA-binding transcriptional regulator n=1 Tax=Pseudarthrobacter sp. NPDC058119 TaxID=3346348 RepID=UPI0036DDE995
MSSTENGAEASAREPEASPKVPGRLQPVTLREVAEAAGVSTATVSLVVNRKKDARIAAETRKRVTDAIRTLGYRPNAMAQTLVSGASRFIGLVADGVASTPFAGQIIHGAQDEAWKHGYALLIANTEGNSALEQDAIAMMLQYKVRGILYSRWFHRQADIPSPLRETDFVLVNCFSDEEGARAVVPDEIQGGRSATELLLAHGHRRIAFINAAIPGPATDGRLAGYRQALEDAGISFDPDLVMKACPDQEGGYLATAALLMRGAPAVFCYNDRMAMGLYDGLREQGLSIPGDIAVVGFDNQEAIAAHLRPPLSTVALPHYELGAAGVRMLLGIDPAPGGPAKIHCPAVERASVQVQANA